MYVGKNLVLNFWTSYCCSYDKRFTQLNEGAVPGKPGVVHVDARSLIPLEKKKTLRAVNLIKEKTNGKLKG